MASSKDIRSNIKSVQNTQKITKAMQMVATSKMRKTQEYMRNARPYAEHIQRIMTSLSQVNTYAKNNSQFLRSVNKVEKVGIILITSDKGLCGGLNTNAIKIFYEKVQYFMQNNIQVAACAIGQKAYLAIKRLDINMPVSAVNLGDVPHMEKLLGPLSYFLSHFYEGELDQVLVIYSKFVNTMKQEPRCKQLLPLTSDTFNKQDSTLTLNDYEYEPSALDVLNKLVRRYVEAVTYQCLADNMAAEQVARMMAMKAATDNATDAISDLRLIYNKTRQASITKELAEIVAGSAAV